MEVSLEYLYVDIWAYRANRIEFCGHGNQFKAKTTDFSPGGFSPKCKQEVKLQKFNGVTMTL